MKDEHEKRFFDIKKAAEFLHSEKEELDRLVEEKRIPHSVLPFGKILFDPERLRDWVISFEQMPEYKGQKSTVGETEKIPFAEQILRKFGCIVKARSKYINIYKGQTVYAQLHPTRTGDGIDLALRECGDDPDLPECKIVKRIGIRELKGYWKANKNWLEGDGRFTKHPAAAFLVPSELSGNPQHPGWKELEQLLKYAYEKK